MIIQENKYQDALNNIENKLNKNNASKDSEQEKKVIGFNKNSTSDSSQLNESQPNFQKKEIGNHDPDIQEVPKTFEDKKLERKQKNHDFMIKNMQLDNEIKIRKANEQTELEMAYLQNKVRLKEKKLIKGILWGGRIISFFAIILVIITTTLTIGGQSENFIGKYIEKNGETVFQIYTIFTWLPFVLFAIAIQSIIYVSCVFRTTIQTKFYRLDTPISFIRNLLLVFSIYSNYVYFQSKIEDLSIYSLNGIMIFIMCVMLDMTTVIFTSLGYDMKTLNYHSNSTIQRVKFLAKLWKILTNPLTKWVDQKFNNIEEPNETNDNRTSKKQNFKSTGKTSAKAKNDSIESSTTRNENNNNSNNTTARHTQTTNNATNNTSDRYYKKIRSYIERLKSKNIETVDVELLKEKCNVSAPIWRKTRDILVDENILNFNGRITKIIL